MCRIRARRKTTLKDDERSCICESLLLDCSQANSVRMRAASPNTIRRIVAPPETIGKMDTLKKGLERKLSAAVEMAADERQECGEFGCWKCPGRGADDRQAPGRAGGWDGCRR